MSGRLAAVPRVSLAALPTPLELRPGLSEAVGVEVWVKRDDLTGLGVGGNKARKLEYLVADARAQGADVLVTAGGPQSNHTALTALAAGRAGLGSHLVHYGNPPAGPSQGNRVLSELAGAQVTYTGSTERASVDPAMARLADALRRTGRTPYVIPRGGATPLGCVGYVRASLELAGQLAEAGVTPTRVFVATGSCGTHAGLEVGVRWLQTAYRVVGVTVSRPAAECRDRIRALAEACAGLLDLDLGPPLEPEVLEGYLAPGYGLRSPAGDAATALLARTEGLLLDPVYTAKAMAALLERAAEDPGPIVFWHTGGAPSAFATTE